MVKWYARDPHRAIEGMTELSLQEVGAYNLLLDHAYARDGDLPDDNDLVARMLRCHWRTWKTIKEQLLAKDKIKIEDGKIVPRGVQETLKNASKVSQRQSKNSSKRWQEFKKRNENNGGAQDWDSHVAPTPTPTPTPTPRNHRHPANGTGNGHAKADDDKTAFSEFERALRSIEGISAHPVAVAPVVAPIWKLVEAGYSLHTTVIPSIRRQLARAGKPVSGWGYFVKGIVDDAQTAAVPSAPAPATKTDAEWERLLEWGRRKKVWDLKTLGERPPSPGCAVPGHLLKPDDGQGWIDFKDYRP